MGSLTGAESNLLDPSSAPSAANPAYAVDDRAPYAVLAGNGPGHSVVATNYQLCNDPRGPAAGRPATNDGFARSYHDELVRDRVPNPSPDEVRVVMQAFAPAALPSLNALADAFCLCDNWYAEVPGPTQPNRLYLHAGTSAGQALNNWQRVLDVPTIYNRLADKGLTWAVYAFDQNEVLEFSQVSGQTASFQSFQNRFAADVAAGALANYAFVIPRFFNATDGMANSQHAPEDAHYGDNLIADVYAALRANAAVWGSSVLIVTYDEHGGFYDHVVPPGDAIPNPDGLTSPMPGDPSYAPPFAFDRLGLRVPTVIASPWVKAGRVDSTRYQHTSVLATLTKLFGLGAPLTRRDASANAFDGLFAELDQARADTPAALPRAALPAIAVPPDHPTHPANLPLDPDQRELLLRAYYLTRATQPPTITSATLPITQGEAHDFIRASYRRHFGLI